MNALAKLTARMDTADSLLCVGLDSDFPRLPDAFKRYEYPLFVFNRWVIEQTHEQVCAYKLNTAFYEARGERGGSSLRQTMEYLRLHHPDIVTICDAKRGDIGSSSDAYARSIFDYYGFDAATVSPYLGREALEPFLSRADRACIVLCRTSNPGAAELQDLNVDGKPLWQVVAEKVATEWNAAGNCMLVVGATYPAELGRVRALVGDLPLLVPGVGTQGGDVAAVLRAGLDSAGRGLVINASRAVIFADDPGAAARALRADINAHRPGTHR